MASKALKKDAAAAAGEDKVQAAETAASEAKPAEKAEQAPEETVRTAAAEPRSVREEEAESQPEPVPAPPEAPAVKEAGCQVYIGPTVRGRILYGAVFTSGAEARAVLAAELEACPAMAGLLVGLEDLPLARLEVKKPGTARYVQAAQVRAALINP